MTDRGSRSSRKSAPPTVERSRGPRWRSLVAVLTLVIALATMCQVATTGPTGAVSPVRQATPSGSPPAGTPAASPAPSTTAPCSVVLGIGTATDACVAFVNAVPAGDPVSLATSEGPAVLVEALETGEFADFIAVPGDTDIILEATAGDTVLGNVTVRLAAGTAAVIVLEERYDTAGLVFRTVPVDLAPLPAGQARLVFHHAVTDAAELAVLGLDAPSDGAILPGETTGPITVDAGPSTVTVVPANARDQVLANLDLVLEADLSYVVIIGGTTGDQTVVAIYAAAPVDLT